MFHKVAEATVRSLLTRVADALARPRSRRFCGIRARGASATRRIGKGRHIGWPTDPRRQDLWP